MTSPILIYEVRPDYTDDATKRRAQCTVELHVVITSDGSVRDDVRIVKFLESDPDAQAITAVRQRRFRPGRKDDKPVNTLVRIELTFTLG